MKFINEVYIDLPIEKVVTLFENPDNMAYWQPGFISLETISGKPGTQGSKSRLKYKMGNRNIELIERIVVNNLPQEFIATYETKGIFYIIRNSFIPIPGNKTRWETETEFQFEGIMKLIGWMMPGTFRKQSQQFLDRFKHFAENNGSQ